MPTLSTLRKQARNAPKYVLHCSFGYVADKQELSGCNFTQDINAARQYAVGFDDPAQKAMIWRIAAKAQTGADVSFDVINL